MGFMLQGSNWPLYGESVGSKTGSRSTQEVVAEEVQGALTLAGRMEVS